MQRPLETAGDMPDHPAANGRPNRSGGLTRTRPSARFLPS